MMRCNSLNESSYSQTGVVLVRTAPESYLDSQRAASEDVVAVSNLAAFLLAPTYAAIRLTTARPTKLTSMQACCVATL